MASNILLEYEQSLIATMMLQASSIPSINLRPEDFTDERHGHIYRVIRDRFAASEATDMLSVAEAIEREGKRALVPYVLATARIENIATSPETYAGAIRRHAQMRTATDIGRSLMSGAAARDRDCIDAAIRALMELGREEAQHEFTGKQASTNAYREIQAAFENGTKLRGITTGIDRLDGRLGGWHRGDLNIVGARPSVGKTALLLNFARAALENGHSVGLISAEQPAVQIGQRHLAMHGHLPADRLRSAQLDEDQWSRLTRASVEMASSRYWIYDRSNPTMAEVARVARKWKHAHGMELLLVDYIQRIRSDGNESSPRWERVGEVARSMKNLARDLDIPIIALAQVGRGVEQRSDQRPRMGDLADSSEIEKEADAILMVYRDEVSRPNAGDVDAGVMELLLEKNRHGPVGRVKVAFLAESMRVENLTREERRPTNAEPPAPEDAATRPRRARSVPVDNRAGNDA
jgi:replicative DNA helicase